MGYKLFHPFGSDIPHYRFFFNGQEADNEVYGEGAVLGYEFRQFDARIGRFWSVDPLAGKFPWNSPYAFAENDVVRAIDLESKEKLIVIVGTNEDGTKVKVTRDQEISEEQYNKAIKKLMTLDENGMNQTDRETLRKKISSTSMNISKNKILIFSVITIGLFIVLYLMFSNTNKKFDSKEWKEWKETESTLSLRYDMIKDLKNHYNLIGQSKEQIVELLGEPDTAFNHCYYYNLGYSRHGIDTGTLIIVFNNNNTVASFSVISG